MIPLILGALAAGASYVGSERTNAANRREAEKNRQFQERMSSTAAQRSVKDYANAGLNPALAYERTASSPGGATATMGDSISSSVNSAFNARRAYNEIQMMKADVDAKNAAATAARTQAAANSEQAQLTSAQRIRAIQDTNFNFQLQPFMLQKAAADAELAKYLLPEAKSSARFYTNMLQGIGPGMSTARNAAEILKLFRK